VLADAMPWWFHAATLVHLAGVLSMVGVGPAARLAPEAARWAPAAAWLLTAGVVARLGAQVQAAFGEIGITAERVQLLVTDTPWGHGWMWQAAVVPLALLAARRVRTSPGRWHLALAAGLLASAATALTGHAVALPDQIWITTVAHALHVAAAGLWIGTLALLLMSIRTAWAEPPGPARRRRVSDAVLRFSMLALAVVPVLVGSGIVAAFVHLGDVNRLWTSSWGRMLLIKVAVFLAAGACGAVNWQRIAPALDGDDQAEERLRTIGGLEVTLGVAALVLTSILVALPMPAE
jgi:putative copper export protein